MIRITKAWLDTCPCPRSERLVVHILPQESRGLVPRAQDHALSTEQGAVRARFQEELHIRRARGDLGAQNKSELP